MNLLPLAEFLFKHGTQIGAMFSGGSGKGSSFAVDLMNVVEPVIKKHFPELNANNLLDDARATLNAVVASDRSAGQPAPPSIAG